MSSGIEPRHARACVSHERSDDGAPKRAAIYVRVSTDEQAREGYSLDEQERRCSELIEREGRHQVRVYRDAGY